jgi:hypothetical protein
MTRHAAMAGEADIRIVIFPSPFIFAGWYPVYDVTGDLAFGPSESLAGCGKTRSKASVPRVLANRGPRYVRPQAWREF